MFGQPRPPPAISPLPPDSPQHRKQITTDSHQWRSSSLPKNSPKGAYRYSAMSAYDQLQPGHLQPRFDIQSTLLTLYDSQQEIASYWRRRRWKTMVEPSKKPIDRSSISKWFYGGSIVNGGLPTTVAPKIPAWSPSTKGAGNAVARAPKHSVAPCRAFGGTSGLFTIAEIAACSCLRLWRAHPQSVQFCDQIKAQIWTGIPHTAWSLVHPQKSLHAYATRCGSVFTGSKPTLSFNPLSF